MERELKRVNRKISLVLLDCDEDRIHELSRVLTGLPVEFARTDRIGYLDPPSVCVDAVFLVFPAAERWGPRLIVGNAQVLHTTVEDQARGFPRYVVTGVVMGPDDERGPVPETRLLLATALQAVEEHNQQHQDEIRRIAFWVVNLTKNVEPAELRRILEGVLFTGRERF